MDARNQGNVYWIHTKAILDLQYVYEVRMHSLFYT